MTDRPYRPGFAVPKNCDLKGCARPPRYRVGFKIWADGAGRNFPPATGYLGLCVCAQCREQCKVEEILSPSAFERVAAALVSRGYAMPAREGAELEFTRL